MINTSILVPSIDPMPPDHAYDDAQMLRGCSSSSTSTSQDARFSCSICLESAHDPVVTRCGHLYCWLCLYKWLEPGMLPEERADLLSRKGVQGPSSSTTSSSATASTATSTTTMRDHRSAASDRRAGGDYVDITRRACPVCKSFCSVKQIIPIYVRNDTSNNQRCQGVNESSIGSIMKDVSNSSRMTDTNTGIRKHQSNTRIRSLSTGDLNETMVGSECKSMAEVDMNKNIINNRASSQPTISSSNQALQHDIQMSNTIGLRRRNVSSIYNSTNENEPYTNERNESNTQTESTLPLRPLPPRSLAYTHPDMRNTYPTSSTPPSASDGLNVADNNLPSSSQMPRSLFQSLLGLPHEAFFPSMSHPSSPIRGNSSHGDPNNTMPSGSASAAELLTPITRNNGHQHSAPRGLSHNTGHDSRNHHNLEEFNLEDAATDFLSRLLLMLGSFVILCLLLF